ncbi:MT-A70 family methyltransferase [Mesorhizobium sp. M0203]|uniref:MT-A70 family methyltransferase n=1 Tax=Mesorhizobium sp. M0203 TaxID=2956912 RepID=UPI0033381B82
MKYQLLPPLSPDEFTSLERSIIAHGVLVPVEYDEAGEIIDGHHRVQICESLGLVDWPRFVRKGLSETDKRALSRELNFARRHMTTSQKQDVIADQLRDTPSISSRAIAGMLGVHHSTVEGVRKRLVDGGEISHHEEVEGKDGVRQPARKAIKTAFVPDRENVGEFLKGAKIIRAEKQKIAHTVRLAHMDMVRETGGASAPGKLMRQYAVGYADPPWKFGVRSEVTGREKSAENHYPTMTTDEIIALFRELDPFTENAVFFCWATNPMLLDALRLLEAVGFTYVHHWVWDKEVAGTGYWGRDRHEILLIGRRGGVAPPLPGSQPETVFRERKGKHSAKPDFYAETIERLFPGVARLEMFCRSPRPGWDHWGFEAGPSEGPVDLPPAEKAGEIAEQSGSPATDDDLYRQAVDLVLANDKASPSFVQRKLQLNYNTATVLMERMERDGYVSAPDHAGKRAVVKIAFPPGVFPEAPKAKRGRSRKAVPA